MYGEIEWARQELDAAVELPVSPGGWGGWLGGRLEIGGAGNLRLRNDFVTDTCRASKLKTKCWEKRLDVSQLAFTCNDEYLQATWPRRPTWCCLLDAGACVVPTTHYRSPAGIIDLRRPAPL